MRVSSKKLREIDDGLHHSYLLSETGRAMARELLALRELERAVRLSARLSVTEADALAKLDTLGPVSD